MKSWMWMLRNSGVRLTWRYWREWMTAAEWRAAYRLGRTKAREDVARMQREEAERMELAARVKG